MSDDTTEQDGDPPHCPRHICQHLIDVTGDAMFNDDFDTFADCFKIPHRIETFEAHRIVRTLDDLRSVFDGVRAHHNEIGATAIVRRSIAAEFIAPDRISSTHRSWVMRDSIILLRPYPVHSVMEKIGGAWKVSDSRYAIVDAPTLSGALDGSLDNARLAEPT